MSCLSCSVALCSKLGFSHPMVIIVFTNHTLSPFTSLLPPASLTSLHPPKSPDRSDKKQAGHSWGALQATEGQSFDSEWNQKP